MLHGHHVSKAHFTPVIGRVLLCANERGNVHWEETYALK